MNLKLIEQRADGAYAPTGLAILLFEKHPRDRYPQAVLKVHPLYESGEELLEDMLKHTNSNIIGIYDTWPIIMLFIW